MRSRPSYPNPWRILIPIVFLTMMSVLPATAGRNANGALIVHTDDAVTYTGTDDYCATSFLPASCEAAVTRTDKDEDTPAVIWFLAAFPDTSSPAVTTIQFGIDHNLPAGQGYFEAHGKCGELEMPDTGWPETGFGNLLSFGSAAKTDQIFCYYWFAAYGFEGAYFGTRTYPSTDEAKFVDDGNPPVEDPIDRFGVARWYLPGDNSCPENGGLDSGPDSPSDPGEAENNESVPVQDLEEDPRGELTYAQLDRSSDVPLHEIGNIVCARPGTSLLGTIGPDGVVCRATSSARAALALAPEVLFVTSDSIPGLPPLDEDRLDSPLDPRSIWNLRFETEEDTSGFGAEEVCGPPPGDRANTPQGSPDAQTSAYMIGKVGVQVIFVESENDATCNATTCVENWTSIEMAYAWNEIYFGVIEYFADQIPEGNLSFSFNSPITVHIASEPIQLPTGDYSWEREVFDHLGYHDSSPIVAAYSFNNAMRRAAETDWFYTVLMVDNSCQKEQCGGSGNFPDGIPSWARHLGPFLVMLPSTRLDVGMYTGAHETAHVFGASDEYYQGEYLGDCHSVDNCDDEFGYLHGANDNCWYCVDPQAPCIMWFHYGNSKPICSSTAKQIGWHDYDGDGPYDPIDHPNAGRGVLIGEGEYNVSRGDRVVISTEPGGNFVKTLVGSATTIHTGVIAWDGVDYTSGVAPTGLYRWSRNGVAMGQIELQTDAAEPTISELSLPEVLEANTQVPLTLAFSDTDTRAGYVRVRSTPTDLPGQWTTHVRDKFYRHCLAGATIDTTITLGVPGAYLLELHVWDVGGGHDAIETLGYVVSAPGTSSAEESSIQPVRLGSATPNPSADRVSWMLDATGGGIWTFRVLSADGRVVREWDYTPQPGQRTSVSWDGKDSQGKAAPSGVYYLSYRGPQGRQGQVATVRIK